MAVLIMQLIVQLLEIVRTCNILPIPAIHSVWAKLVSTNIFVGFLLTRIIGPKPPTVPREHLGPLEPNRSSHLSIQ